MTDLTKPKQPLLSMLQTGWYVKSCWTIWYRAIESICTYVKQHPVRSHYSDFRAERFFSHVNPQSSVSDIV